MVKVIKMVKMVKMVPKMVKMVMVIFKLTSPDLTNPLIHSFDEVDTCSRGAVFPGVTGVLTRKFHSVKLILVKFSVKRSNTLKRGQRCPVST